MCMPHYLLKGKEHFYENDDYVEDYPCESHHPEWCKYCTHFGFTDRHNACAEGPAIQIFSYGPATVSFSGHCNKFAWAANQGGTYPNPSKIKRFLLSIDNFKYACDKQR